MKSTPRLLGILSIIFFLQVPVVWGAPTAYNGTLTVIPGGTRTVTLSSSAPSGTFTILTSPTKGTLTKVSGNQYQYKCNMFTVSGSYVNDSFTWKVNDGSADSNIATCTVYIYPNKVPVAPQQLITAYSGLRKAVLLSYTDGDALTYGQVMTLKCTVLPKNGGKLEYFDAATSSYQPVVLNAPLQNGVIYYTSKAGYVGPDNLGWSVSDGVATTSSSCAITVVVDAYGKDWPMFRRDEHRTANSSIDLPDTLHLQWIRDLPPQLAAWPALKTNIMKHWFPFDEGYEPIVIGKMMYVASTRTDSLTAYDTTTGEEKWRFYTGAPVRLAPAGWKDGATTRIYFGSDDGNFYCVDGITGQQLWKIAIGYSQRFFFCNNRLVSTSMSRGGPVVYQGKVYFAGGLIPFEGTFVYAVDGRTGAIVWKTDESSLMRTGEPHSGPGISGVSPQGCLVISKVEPKVYVPSGHATRGAADLTTGKLDPWDQGGTGDTLVSCFVNADGQEAVYPYSPGSTLKRPGYPVDLISGSKVYTTGPGVVGVVHRLIAADDRLFVVTKEGKIYCFGGASVSSPKTWTEPVGSLASASDQWTTQAASMLSDNPEGSCLVWGIGSGRLVEELAKQAKAKLLKLHINAFDPDVAKCNVLRKKLDSAGLYGSEDLNVRVSVHVGDPWEMEFPTYASRLIATEDPLAAGFGYGSAFAQKLFASLRPYGGTAWLPISSTEHTSFSGWVSALSLTQAVLERSLNLTLLTRSGALPGSSNFVNVDGTPVTSIDKVAKPPFGVQWCGDEYLFGGSDFDEFYSTGADVRDGRLISGSFPAGKAWDVYTGLPFTTTSVWSGKKVVKSAESMGLLTARKNPFNGLEEERAVYKQWGCGTARGYGDHVTFRSGSAAFYHIPAETGTISMGFMRPGCFSNGMIPANGVLLLGGTPSSHHCDCPYLVRASVALVNRPNGYQSGIWGPDRSRRTIEEEPIRKVGVNFGGIGERMNNGTLWIHRPVKMKFSPIVPVTMEPSASISHYIHPTAWLKDSSDMGWVASSGVKGAEQIKLNLAYPSVVTHSCSTPPSIDGNLSDACWDGSSQVTLYGTAFGTSNSKVVLPPNKLETGLIQFRYDANKLYVGFKYIGDISKMETGKEDAWDLFITDRSKAASYNFVHFRVNGAGVKYQGIRTGKDIPEDSSWNGTWTAASQSTTANFIVEMAIPWSTIQGAGFVKNDVVIGIQGPNCAPTDAPITFAETLMLRRHPRSDGTDEDLWRPGSPKPPQRFNPLFFDAAGGDLAKVRNYDVSLYFAEPDEIAIGARVFDIQLQGITLASNVDIVKEAGGNRRTLIKKFSGIKVKDILEVKLVPKAGVPVICGLEAIEQGVGVVDSIAPSVPAGLVASASSSTQINLSWTGSTDNVGVAGYKIYRGTIQIGTSSGTTYSDTGLTASTAYTYKVAAYDAAGNTSGQSTAASATTLAATDATPPTVPSGLAASAVSSSQINLSWTASTDAVGVAGYKIYRGSTQVGTSAGTSYSDTGLSASTAYTYKVAAYDAAGNNSAQSSAASATTLSSTGGGDSDGDGLPDAWEVANFGSISDPQAKPGLDTDADGLSNADEYKAGTSPVDSSSRLTISTETFPTTSSFRIQWQSVVGKTYEVQSSTDGAAWTTVATVAATSSTTTWTDSGVGSIGKKMYRVRIP